MELITGVALPNKLAGGALPEKEVLRLVHNWRTASKQRMRRGSFIAT